MTSKQRYERNNELFYIHLSRVGCLRKIYHDMFMNHFFSFLLCSRYMRRIKAQADREFQLAEMYRDCCTAYVHKLFLKAREEYHNGIQ